MALPKLKATCTQAAPIISPPREFWSNNNCCGAETANNPAVHTHINITASQEIEAAKKMETAPTVVNIHTIKPIDKELIVELAKTHDKIVTCEEHSIIGGLGSAVAEVLAEAGTACKLVRVGVQDVFGESGKPAQLFAKYKIDADAIVEACTK